MEPVGPAVSCPGIVAFKRSDAFDCGPCFVKHPFYQYGPGSAAFFRE